MEAAAAETGTAAVKAGACSPLVKIVIAVVAGVVITGTAVGVGVGLTVGNNGRVDTVTPENSTQTPGTGPTVTGVTYDVTGATNDVTSTDDPTETGPTQDTTGAGVEGTTGDSGSGSMTTDDTSHITDSSKTGETTESGIDNTGGTTQASGITQGGSTQNGAGTTQYVGQINTGATTQVIGDTTQNGGFRNTEGTTVASGTSSLITTTQAVTSMPAETTTAPPPQTTTPGYTCTNGYTRTVVMVKFSTTDNVFFRGGGENSGNVRLNHTGEPFGSPLQSAFLKYYYWIGGDNFLDWGTSPDVQRNYNGVEQAGGSPAAKTSNVVSDENYYHLNTFGTDYWAMDTCMHCKDVSNGFFEVKVYRVMNQWESDIAQAAVCDGTASLVQRTKPTNLNGNHVGRCGAINVFEYGQGMCTINSF